MPIARTTVPTASNLRYITQGAQVRIRTSHSLGL